MKKASKAKSVCTCLSAKNAGVAVGIVCALWIGLLGLSAMLFGYGTAIVNMAASLYIGYAATPMGIIIGMVLGFIDGFVCAWLVISIYNKLGKCKACN